MIQNEGCSEGQHLTTGKNFALEQDPCNATYFI